MHLRCGGIFNYWLTRNLLPNLYRAVKEFWFSKVMGKNIVAPLARHMIFSAIISGGEHCIYDYVSFILQIQWLAFSSFVSIVPVPSASNRSNASRISCFCSSVNSGFAPVFFLWADTALPTDGFLYWLVCKVQTLALHIPCTCIWYDTIRWTTFTCAQKLTNSQLNLPHGIKQKRVMKKLKTKKTRCSEETVVNSVVTVSKCFLSVGFGRFCRKKPRFSVRFRFSW